MINIKTEDKIVIKQNRIRLLWYSLLSLAFFFAGILFMKDSKEIISYVVVIVFGIFFMILLYLTFKPNPCVTFDKSGLEIKLASKEKIFIPWKDIKKIGSQIRCIPVNDNSVWINLGDQGFISICLNNPEKYKFDLKFNDKDLLETGDFKSSDSYLGDKADLRIKLGAIMNDKKIVKTYEKLSKIPNVRFEKFHPLIFTKDQNLYDKLAVSEWKSKKTKSLHQYSS